MCGGEATGIPVRSWPAEARVRFAATSTLHNFGGELAAQPFTLVISNGTWSVEADVLASLMKTGSAGRDRSMYKMMNTNSYRQLHGSVVRAPLPTTSGTNVTLNLKIRDRKIDLPVRVTDWQETAGAIRFHAAWEVSLKQYGLEPSSVMGVIRVGDPVRLDADVTAQKPAPAPAASTQRP